MVYLHCICWGAANLLCWGSQPTWNQGTATVLQLKPKFSSCAQPHSTSLSILNSVTGQNPLLEKLISPDYRGNLENTFRQGTQLRWVKGRKINVMPWRILRWLQRSGLQLPLQQRTETRRSLPEYPEMEKAPGSSLASSQHHTRRKKDTELVLWWHLQPCFPGTCPPGCILSLERADHQTSLIRKLTWVYPDCIAVIAGYRHPKVDQSCGETQRSRQKNRGGGDGSVQNEYSREKLEKKFTDALWWRTGGVWDCWSLQWGGKGAFALQKGWKAVTAWMSNRGNTGLMEL